MRQSSAIRVSSRSGRTVCGGGSDPDCSWRTLALSHAVGDAIESAHTEMKETRVALHPPQMASKFIRTLMALAFPSARISGRIAN